MRPFIFIQSVEIFKRDIVVCVGATKEQTMAYLKKIKGIKKDVIKSFEGVEKELFDEVINNSALGIAVEEDNMLLLILKPYQNCWEYWDTLLHETNHIVRFLQTKITLDRLDYETEAYLHEFLFREIREKLIQKHDKNKRRT